jgi:Arc/MetJ-type ribon-helix-helix transcriptional regulator
MKRKKARNTKRVVHAVEPTREQLLERTKPINVKLTFTEHKFVRGLVSAGHYESMSGAFRAGLGMLMTIHGFTEEEEQQIERERARHRPRRPRSPVALS